MTLELTKAREELQAQGACCVRGVFDARWIDLVREGIDQTIVQPSRQSKTWSAPEGQGRFFQDGFAWIRIEPLRSFIFDSPAGRLVAELMQSSRVHIYMDHLLIREPNTDKTTPWHHDTPYCFVDGKDFCTIWLPLDPIERGQGLRLVSGSHRWGKMFLPVEFGSTQTYARDAGTGDQPGCDVVPDIDGSPQDYEILTWDVGLGDCIVFYCNMLHSAPAHLKPGRRRVYSTRWVGDDARWTTRSWAVPPPPIDPGLKPGDPFGGELFPRVY